MRKCVCACGDCARACSAGFVRREHWLQPLCPAALRCAQAANTVLKSSYVRRMELSLASLCSACFAARALDCVAGGRGVGALPLASARRQSGGWPAAGAAASSSVTHFSPSTRGMPCCYLLRSRASPTRSYIGYTVDPAARLKRHNGIGGAKATRNHRPWEYVCVVSGFTSDTAAKCFEYAWQQPRTPWPQMQERLRIKGLLGATPAYAALRALTKDLHRYRTEQNTGTATRLCGTCAC